MVGHKVGLSSEAMQKMMNVDEPDYGHLLADMEVFEDVPVKAANYLFPRVEVEVGFILADDLPGAGCTRTTCWRPPPRSRRRSSSSTAGSRTGRSNCATPSPTTRPRRVGCSAGTVSPKDVDIRHPGDPPVQRRGWARPQRRGAGQPGDRGRLAGPQGGQLRVRLKAGDVVLPGACMRDRCTPGRQFRRRVHRARFSPTVI